MARLPRQAPEVLALVAGIFTSAITYTILVARPAPAAPLQQPMVVARGALDETRPITAGDLTQTVTYTAGASGNVQLNLSVVLPNGCHQSNSINVPINPIPAAPTIDGADGAYCSGALLTSSAASGTTCATRRTCVALIALPLTRNLSWRTTWPRARTGRVSS